jgi:hypothetical protein
MSNSLLPKIESVVNFGGYISLGIACKTIHFLQEPNEK